MYESRNAQKWCIYFCPQIFTFCPQLIFYSLFLNEDDGISKSRLSKLHYQFRRYTSLRLFNSSLNDCKVMEVFLIFSCQILRKTIITSILVNTNEYTRALGTVQSLQTCQEGILLSLLWRSVCHLSWNQQMICSGFRRTYARFSLSAYTY